MLANSTERLGGTCRGRDRAPSQVTTFSVYYYAISAIQTFAMLPAPDDKPRKGSKLEVFRRGSCTHMVVLLRRPVIGVEIVT